jgi:uncharacterized protein with GYD domain
MGTYTALVDVADANVQNVQEFASVWGDIRQDIEDSGGELQDAYAILGEHDFLVLFEAGDQQQALQIALSMERYGLDTQTMEIIPVEQFGEIVEDI